MARRDPGVSGDDGLVDSGSAWERAPTTERLRPGRDFYLMDHTPYRCQ